MKRLKWQKCITTLAEESPVDLVVTGGDFMEKRTDTNGKADTMDTSRTRRTGDMHKLPISNVGDNHFEEIFGFQEGNV